MVMPSKEAKTNGAAGIDAEGGRRPTAVPAPATVAPELLDRPRRRTFTAQTKLRVLAEKAVVSPVARGRRGLGPDHSVGSGRAPGATVRIREPLGSCRRCRRPSCFDAVAARTVAMASRSAS